MNFPTQEKEARHLLNLVEPLGPVRFARLLERFGSILEALHSGPAGWASIEGFGEKASDFYRKAQEAIPLLKIETDEIVRLKARVLCALDEEYPEGFRRLRDAPPLLYVWGKLLPVDDLGIALVGSRRPTPYGTAAAERLAREFAQAGVTVVSGLARGIDGAAHGAALAGGGRTVGILGSGLNRFYPLEHRKLADRVAENGAVVTEFPLTAGPEANHFPRRNRLIAALSVGVVVVEALERSGALITAGLAADQGRDVFAVPGSIFSPFSRGPHRLIKQGAKPVESAQDVLEEMDIFRDVSRKEPVSSRSLGESARETLSPAGRKLLDVLTLDPTGIDGLARSAGLSAAEATRELLVLELAGWARARPGKNYVATEMSMMSDRSKKEPHGEITAHR